MSTTFHDRVARECSQDAALLREVAERLREAGLPDAILLEAAANRLESLQYDALVDAFRMTYGIVQYDDDGVPRHVDPDAITTPLSVDDDPDTKGKP